MQVPLVRSASRGAAWPGLLFVLLVGFAGWVGWKRYHVVDQELVGQWTIEKSSVAQLMAREQDPSQTEETGLLGKVIAGAVGALVQEATQSFHLELRGDRTFEATFLGFAELTKEDIHWSSPFAKWLVLEGYEDGQPKRSQWMRYRLEAADRLLLDVRDGDETIQLAFRRGA